MRHIYRIDLLCPRCGATGVADVAQIADQHTNRLDFNVDHVSKGFYVSKLTNSPATTQLRCTGCGIDTTTTENGTRSPGAGTVRD